MKRRLRISTAEQAEASLLHGEVHLWHDNGTQAWCGDGDRFSCRYTSEKVTCGRCIALELNLGQRLRKGPVRERLRALLRGES